MFMPWCPKCKTEYQEGIKRCADCDTELVDELPQELVCIMTLPEENALELLSYYEYCQVDYCTMQFDKASGNYHVMVPKSRERDVRKPTEEYLAKLSKEKKTASGAGSDSSSRTQVRSSYKKSSDRLEDARSSAMAFLLVGGIGLLLVVLFALGILSFPFGAASRTLMLTVMGLLFLIFLVVGIQNAGKLSRLKEEASAEESRTGEILSWFLGAFSSEQVDEGCELTDSEEINYYKRTEYIKEQLSSRYPLDEDYLDSLSETIYSRLYE